MSLTGVFMKGVESFLYLLVVAIVIIVVLSLFSGSIFVQPEEEGSFQVLEEFQLGTVGVSQDFASKTISLGELRVGETQEELLKKVLKMDISQGIAGGEKEELAVQVSPAFLELKKGVKISFSMLEANPLGNMVVKWNGKVFYSAKPSGLTELEIGPQYVKGENYLVVEAEGPGLMFWAYTYYSVKNFRVYALYGPQVVVPFEVLPSELQSFDRGEVSFFGSGAGTLEIKVNGVGIFSKIPAGPEEAEFNMGSVPLNVGNNVLSFISSGTNMLSGAVFRIYSLGSQLVKARKFQLEETDLDAISSGKGRIDFIIDSFIKSGIMEIRLNGNKVDIQAIQEGENTVHFPGSMAQEGENTIEFSGTGAWDISEVKIGYE